MSALSSLLGGTATATQTANGTTLSSSTNGMQSLTPSDFVNFLVTELQNQDPLDPTSADQMLGQISEIGQLEAADDTQTSLTGMVQQNQVASASNMIGKAVTGTDQNNNAISGNVSGVQVNSGNVTLQLDNGGAMPLANLLTITAPATSTTSSTGSTNTSTTQPSTSS